MRPPSHYRAGSNRPDCDEAFAFHDAACDLIQQVAEHLLQDTCV